MCAWSPKASSLISQFNALKHPTPLPMPAIMHTLHRSKLANIMFTYELARRLKGTSNITTNCLHPGVVRTELGRYMLTDQSSFVTKAMWALMTPFTKSPIQGAQTNIHLASSPEVEGISGKYYADEK